MNLSDQEIQILQGKICPYCKRSSEYVDSSIIYGRSYGMIYLCKPCDAYVGVHKGTDQAKGRLANRVLRDWKKKAHSEFDKLWKGEDPMIKPHYNRGDAYAWLSNQLGIDPEYCHIGMFSVHTCQRVINKCRELTVLPF